MNRAVEKTITSVQRESRLRAPRDTGHMNRMIRVKQSELEGEVGVNVKYGIYFEAPYYRKPRRGGVGESQFFTRAIKARTPHIKKYFQNAISNIIKR